MYVKLGPYNNYIGPYQIVDKLFFWIKKDGILLDDPNENRWDHKLKDKLGDWLAETWVDNFCIWIGKKRKREVVVQIDRWDTWNMDHTLSLIILPMLKRIRDTKHGSPCVDPEDAPTIGKGEDDGHGSDTKFHERWEWVLNEMIWTFEQIADDESDSQFYSGEHDFSFQKNDNGTTSMVTGPRDTFKVDREGLKAWDDRIVNGLDFSESIIGGCGIDGNTIVVDENTLLEANTMCCAMGDVDNSFSRLLKTGQFYKNHGMTPVYTLDETTMVMQVHIKETMKKNLN